MNLVIGLAVWIFIVALLILFVRGAGHSSTERSTMIRTFDRFYAKHPNMAFTAMLLICAVVLYVARCVDWDNTAMLQLQMMAAKSRTAT